MLSSTESNDSSKDNLNDKELKDRLKKLENEYENLDKRYLSLIKDYRILEDETKIYKSIANSFFWKLTKPLRVGCDLVRKSIHSLKVGVKLILKGTVSLFKVGPKKTYQKFKARLLPTSNYCEYFKRTYPTKQELDYEKGKYFKKPIKFSIVVPLYNTPENFLRQMIESVLNQSYNDLELCLADASDEQSDKIFKIFDEYFEYDKRLKYKKLEKNEGIPQNTNEALKMAEGEYIVLLDHDDMLAPNALYECMCAIEKDDADFIYSDEMVFEGELENIKLIHFKPDFSPDTLRSHNYICHICVFSKELQEEVGYFNDEYNGSQDYDMILRLSEKAKNIVHIPKVLYYWREHEKSVTSNVMVKPYCMDSAKRAIGDHLNRVGLKGKVYDSSILSTYRVEYEIKGSPKISIIIPNMDHINELEVCIKSIIEKSTYKNFEIIIVENNSVCEETFSYYDNIQKSDDRVKVVYYKEKGFNYPALNEFGVEHASGDYLLLLNNDTEVITNDWLEQMLMFLQRDDVGVVGSMLYYPDDTIQHAGLIIGLGGAAAHAHRNFLRGDGGYIHRTAIAQNLSGVTGACLMTKKSVWNEVGGMNKELKVAFNDVDFCLRVRKKGYLIIFTPYAELYHHESKSRGYEDSKEKKKRYKGEYLLLQEIWKKEIDEGDPYYNPNLTLYREDFTLR